MFYRVTITLGIGPHSSLCDNLLFTSGFASESTSKLDSLDSRIWIRVRALNGQIH